MGKLFHSLRFQLPAVAVGVFLGFLFLLMLFFHEMTTILVKTRQLAQSAEVNDFVGHWMAGLSSSARERTKLMSLGKEGYLLSFQSSLNEVNELYNSLQTIRPDTAARSTQELEVLHGKHIEYMELLDGFAKEQMARRQAALLAPHPSRALLQSPRAAAVPAVVKAAPEKRSARKSVQRGKGAPRRAGKTKAKSAAPALPRPTPPRPAAPVEPSKEIELDNSTNETFKAYEQELREGLFRVQQTMRGERKDKLQSLRNSVGRAKDRLIYSLLLLLAMVCYVAVILKWKILDPMKILERGALEIGKGSLGYQVKVNSRNEIGELAEVFNRMSVQLDQKQNAEFRLKRLEAIEQVVRSVNHEINNPLMVISGNAEYLLAILDACDDNVKSKLNSIVDEVRRIFIVTQRLKEIKEPITESYIGDRDQMIDLVRSSQIKERDF